MPEKIRDRHGNVVGSRGSEVGKDAKYEAIAEEEARQEFRKANGISGLGGAAKAAKPDFQKREREHLAKWRAERAAKRKAQERAAKNLPKPKPE